MAVATSASATKELNPQIGLAADGSQFLTFNLGEELYGMDILHVQEIKGVTAVTKIPNTPPHIKGVLNLRGTIVPIIELRTRFGMPAGERTTMTVIIVVVVREKVMGLLVDSVSDVVSFDKKDLQPTPKFGGNVDVSFISGIGQSGGKLVTVLDVDRLLTDRESSGDGSAAV